MVLRPIPPVALSLFARLKTDAGIWSAGGARTQRRQWAAGQAGAALDRGFQIHLKLPFCSDGRISMLRGSPMWNGWKKAAIGLSALLAFVLLELMAVIGGDGP